LYTVVIASQKGGSGKTTLSGHLAVEACRAGVGPVSLIDTDPQGSLAQWWNARVAEEPHFVKAGGFDLKDTLAELEQAGFRIAIIDTPPAITQFISQVVAHADLVIVPTRPSPHDLRAVGVTVDIAERHRKPLIFVVNAANARARITGESAVALSQHGTVAPVIVHHRVDFAASMIDGRTVGEVVPGSPSAREITGLWTYIQNKLSRIVRDAKLIPDMRPAEFAISPLAAAAGDEEDMAFPAIEDVPQAPPLTSLYPDPAKRAEPEPRANTGSSILKGPDRRIHVFGRRQSGQGP
jgi:chromosome partitioning protein